GTILGEIVGGRRGAMQVDVIDAMRAKVGAAQRGAHGSAGTAPFGVGRGHVMGVAALSVAKQHQLAFARLEQCEAGRFAYRNAVALQVRRTTRLAGYELQGIEPIERREAEAVDAANQCGIAIPGADSTPRG